MPQAPQHLQDRWTDDGAAFEQLAGRFVVTRGGVIKPKTTTVPTEADLSAIDYLILEWDYGYDSEPYV